MKTAITAIPCTADVRRRTERKHCADICRPVLFEDFFENPGNECSRDFVLEQQVAINPEFVIK